jgi:threonine/homoserine/homoserine lactone efflux protein
VGAFDTARGGGRVTAQAAVAGAIFIALCVAFLAVLLLTDVRAREWTRRDDLFDVFDEED